MRITKNKIIKWILGFIFFLSNFFILYIYIWINNIIKLVIIICILFTIVYYIEIILIEINFIFKYIYKYYNKIRKIYTIFSFVYIFIYPLEIFTISFNLGIYETNFLKDCPYTINNLDYRLHLERRCELYNINNNSRYLYQYICSYDSSKDFDIKKEINFKNKIKIENVICLPYKNIIKGNKIIELFNNEYNNSLKYYCSRTNKPVNFSYATHEDCNNIKKYAFFLLFLFITILQGIYLKIYYISIIQYHYHKNELVEENNLNINIFNPNLINIKGKEKSTINNDSTLGKVNKNVPENKKGESNENNTNNFSTEINNNNYSNNLLNLNQNTLI